jgi:tRNA(Arg) A34 adenosine deaminase TadA
VKQEPENLQARFMREAIRLSQRAVDRGEGGPFGAVIVRHDRIVGRGWNRVVGTNDPTAHAEVLAIRDACRRLKRVHLEDCELYTSCEPCPMCLSAIYWAHLRQVFFANTRSDAARIGFQDEFLYRELKQPLARRRIPTHTLLRREAREVFAAWMKREDRVRY